MASNNNKIGTFQHKPTTIQAIRLREPLERPVVPKNYTDGKSGDWMLFDHNGRAYFLEDPDFRYLYEPVDDAGQAIFEADERCYER